MHKSRPVGARHLGGFRGVRNEHSSVDSCVACTNARTCDHWCSYPGRRTVAGASRPFGGLSFGNNPGGRFEHHPYPPPFFGNTYTCNGANGGIIPQGTYGSMFITGTCYMPAGNITVRGDLDIAPGALLDAVTPGDPTAAPVVPATVTVGRNVNVGSERCPPLALSPEHLVFEPTRHYLRRIAGVNLTGFGALGVVVHSAVISGNVSLFGGGGGAGGQAVPR